MIWLYVNVGMHGKMRWRGFARRPTGNSADFYNE